MIIHPRTQLLPLDSFDWPKCHIEMPWIPGKLGLIIGNYLSGNPYRPSELEFRQWIKRSSELPREKQATMYEFIAEWTTPDCQTFFLTGGCTLYEIASAMHQVRMDHFLPVNFINRYSSKYEWPTPSALDYVGWGSLARVGWSHREIKRGIS